MYRGEWSRESVYQNGDIVTFDGVLYLCRHHSDTVVNPLYTDYWLPLNGRDGLPGDTGADGMPGPPGPAGRDGVDGKDGSSITQVEAALRYLELTRARQNDPLLAPDNDPISRQARAVIARFLSRLS